MTRILMKLGVCFEAKSDGLNLITELPNTIDDEFSFRVTDLPFKLLFLFGLVHKYSLLVFFFSRPERGPVSTNKPVPFTALSTV